MGLFSGGEFFKRRKTSGQINGGRKPFVFVTAHFTVLEQSKNGNLAHHPVDTANLTLLFDENGAPISGPSRQVRKVLKGLRKSEDGYVILNGNRFLSADIRGGFAYRDFDRPRAWERYRLLPVEFVVEAKKKKTAPDVVFHPAIPRIPRILHQTYSTRTVPDLLRESVESLRELNPSWLYRYWNDEDIIEFIKDAFGWDVLRIYLSINPQYGAARADLFRYLCVFHYGGVYLDIKSSIRDSLNKIIAVDDEYLLSYWNNAPGTRHSGYGIHPQLHFSPRGELQQWHVIAAPQHPFLGCVIERVLNNIVHYHPDVDGWGKQAVLTLSGPIAYTTAILPLLCKYRHRFINYDECSFEYKVLDDHHAYLGGQMHYSNLTTPIVI